MVPFKYIKDCKLKNCYLQQHQHKRLNQPFFECFEAMSLSSNFRNCHDGMRMCRPWRSERGLQRRAHDVDGEENETPMVNGYQSSDLRG